MKQSNNFDHFAGIKNSLLEQHKALTKMCEGIVSGDFQNKLRDIMYEQNKEAEKNGKVKGKQANIVLTKTGEVVFKFESLEDGKIFFDSIK